MDMIRVTLTALLSVAALFLITKIMGHKQVAQLDFFDYISGITIGSIGAELATEPESPYRPLIALAVYGAASVILNMLTMKFAHTRRYINGTPTVLLNNGTLYRDNLKKAKLDVSEFLLLCREQGYFDLEEIQTAVYENNGKLSILPTAANRPVTPQDLHLIVQNTSVGVELIMDGHILEQNLTQIGRNNTWLIKQLTKQGFRDAKSILLAVYRVNEDTLTLYPKT